VRRRAAENSKMETLLWQQQQRNLYVPVFGEIGGK
jgi:hypothetical protein